MLLTAYVGGWGGQAIRSLIPTRITRVRLGIDTNLAHWRGGGAGKAGGNEGRGPGRDRLADGDRCGIRNTSVDGVWTAVNRQRRAFHGFIALPKRPNIDRRIRLETNAIRPSCLRVARAHSSWADSWYKVTLLCNSLINLFNIYMQITKQLRRRLFSVQSSTHVCSD